MCSVRKRRDSATRLGRCAWDGAKKPVLRARRRAGRWCQDFRGFEVHPGQRSRDPNPAGVTKPPILGRRRTFGPRCRTFFDRKRSLPLPGSPQLQSSAVLQPYPGHPSWNPAPCFSPTRVTPVGIQRRALPLPGSPEGRQSAVLQGPSGRGSRGKIVERALPTRMPVPSRAKSSGKSPWRGARQTKD